MKNGGGQFTPKLGGHFELKLGGQYHWNLQLNLNFGKLFFLFWFSVSIFTFIF